MYIHMILWSTYLSINLSVCLSFCLSLCLSVCLSVFLSACLSFCLSVYLPLYLSVPVSISISISISFFTHPSMDLWTNLKGSNSAKLPSKVEDDRPKEKQACDTSKNESSQLQNDKFCDCRQKWQLTTPKRWNSARLLQFSNLARS